MDHPMPRSVCLVGVLGLLVEAAEYRKVVDLLARLEKDVWSLREIYNPTKNQTNTWYRGFLKWWVTSPTKPMGFFPTKFLIIILGCGDWGVLYHHLTETPSDINVPWWLFFGRICIPKGQLDRVLVSAEAGIRTRKMVPMVGWKAEKRWKMLCCFARAGGKTSMSLRFQPWPLGISNGSSGSEHTNWWNLHIRHFDTVVLRDEPGERRRTSSSLQDHQKRLVQDTSQSLHSS